VAVHIKLQVFEGPMDLLLHLINKSKVKIEDVSIFDITQQYMEYLEQMQQFDIEIASEFLVMAATLLHIKSCMLLPKAEPEVEEDGHLLHQELMRKLKEYKLYKEVSQKLQEREMIFSKVYYKLPEEILKSGEESPDSIFTGVSLEELQKTFIKLLSEKRFHERAPMIHRIERDSVSVRDCMNQLKDFFEVHHEITLFQLFEQYDDRSDMITCFLALLELLHENFIELYQTKPFDDILIRKRKWIHGRARDDGSS